MSIMPRPLTRLAAVSVVSVGLSACSSLLPPSPPPPVAHDFGPLTTPGTAESIHQISLNRITMPEWLDDSEIHYRQLNQDATAVKSYADNVWVASPATMLRQCLTQAGIQSHRMPDTTLALNVSIDDFEQVISDRDRAHIEVSIDVQLRNPGNSHLVASRHFIDHQPVTANVQGAVKGLAKAGQQQCRAIVDWLHQQQKPDPY